MKVKQIFHIHDRPQKSSLFSRAIKKLKKAHQETSISTSPRTHLLQDDSDNLKNGTPMNHEFINPTTVQNKHCDKQQSEPLVGSHNITVPAHILHNRRMGLPEDAMKKDIFEIRMKTFLQSMDTQLW